MVDCATVWHILQSYKFDGIKRGGAFQDLNTDAYFSFAPKSWNRAGRCYRFCPKIGIRKVYIIRTLARDTQGMFGELAVFPHICTVVKNIVYGYIELAPCMDGTRGNPAPRFYYVTTSTVPNMVHF